ncbi:hypothetical protein C7S20_07250 [Christiangramia fulva]|uniref:Uncharacterized protein n=1 Tax=Christiangramia fulva TaxID=2126553 RepID=A0A2R3Z482_9FLAO|nr:DUF6789 family protein [Christiangramia fulva]AVR45080.1 hypothetical protein C7S20_07250 [Christiangramia fulva]
MKSKKLKIGFLLLLLLLSAVGPILFPLAQAGYGKLSVMALKYLVPSIILIFIVLLFIHNLKFSLLKRQIITGILAGFAGTIGLEIVRIIGYKIGWMPGNLPQLMGVLLLDQFATGPNLTSNLAGWAYHFWNGAAFGIIYSLLTGRGKIWMGMVFGFLIGVGFMVSPVVKSLGIGIFGLQFKDGYQFIMTVVLAHLAFGAVLGFLVKKMNKGTPGFPGLLKS